VVVDSNVERVVSRLFAVKEGLPASREAIYALADTITPDQGAGDFAQAMMDLGSAICTPRAPQCLLCPLADHCAARTEGAAAAYPVKRAKAERPRRRGFAYWLEHDGHVLLVRRPAKGLLGGMLALPSGPWNAAPDPADGAPAPAEWRSAGAIEHVFTHFALELSLLCAQVPGRDCEGTWWPVERIGEAGLPTVFAKAAARGAAWRDAA
jgi:A/G-specific adenine glycosylase